MKMRNTKENSGQQQKSNNENVMKRPLTLDLNKKAFGGHSSDPPILNTPDVNKFKLESPELENFILNTATLQTPSLSLETPTPGIFPAPVGSSVTTEQENYAKGFEDALKNLHDNDNDVKTKSASTITTGGMSGGGITTYAQDESNLMLQIKEEPQLPIDSEHQSMNPIDMASQEKIKLERKRQRNRVAASKCRKRKLERISKLEDRVKILKVENGELGSVLTNLRQHVFDLKQQIIDHHNSGCHISMKT